MAKNVATESKHVCCYHNGERTADAALPRGRRSVRRAIRLVHGQKGSRAGSVEQAHHASVPKAMRSDRSNSASSAGLSTVSKNARRFVGFGGRRASARGTGACGPDLAR